MRDYGRVTVRDDLRYLIVRLDSGLNQRRRKAGRADAHRSAATQEGRTIRD